VDGGDSIGTVRAYDRKVGHANLTRRLFFHETNALDAPLVAREAKTHFVEQTPINFVNDFQMPGE
jgi:hypothetical protein